MGQWQLRKGSTARRLFYVCYTRSPPKAPQLSSPLPTQPPPPPQQQRRRTLPTAPRAAPDGGPPTQSDKPKPKSPPLDGAKTPPVNGGDGDGSSGGGGPPELPPMTRRVLALLVEYGGLYGSAACILGYFLHIDPFGGLHWSAADALLGLQLYAPLLLFDALVMLPDYSAKEDQADQVSRMFFGAAAMTGATAATAAAAAGEGKAGAAEGKAVTGKTIQLDLKPEAPQQQPSPLLRLQVSLELLQSFQTRANPAAGLPLWQETAVGAIGSLADEMLYRAVALTFLAGWLK